MPFCNMPGIINTWCYPWKCLNNVLPGSWHLEWGPSILKKKLHCFIAEEDEELQLWKCCTHLLPARLLMKAPSPEPEALR